jgi:hypothetical protein
VSRLSSGEPGIPAPLSSPGLSEKFTLPLHPPCGKGTETASQNMGIAQSPCLEALVPSDESLPSLPARKGGLETSGSQSVLSGEQL